MKKISLVVGILFLIVASFSSCKKEQVFSRHIFWFDKATSDSLTAAGVTLLSSSPVNYKPGDDDRWWGRVDVDHWYASQPEFDPYGMLSVSIAIDKGETKNFGYDIRAMASSMSGVDIIQHMPMSQGTFEMGHATTTYTQLIWQ